MAWLKIGIIAVIVFAVIYCSWKYYQCKKNGDQIGVAYRCGFCSSTPIMLTPIDEYYGIRYNKCYRFTDFGRSMSVREVEMENCEG